MNWILILAIEFNIPERDTYLNKKNKISKVKTRGIIIDRNLPGIFLDIIENTYISTYSLYFGHYH